MPSIDCAGAGFVGNTWGVDGTLTVDASGLLKPQIVPNPQRLPVNQQPSGAWDVIFATKIQGDDPTLPEGWNLLSQSVAGVKKKWSVQK